MWSATITDKKLEHGVLSVFVSYSNGVDEFTEVYALRAGNGLPEMITGRIAQLVTLDSYADTVVMGPFIPLPVVETPPDEQLVALSKLQEAKKLLDLGVITNSDPTYTTALSAAQEVFTDSQPTTVSLIPSI